MQPLINALKFLRLADDDGTLSLTSIMFIAVLWKFMKCPLETEALIALLGAATAYSAKKVIRNHAVKKDVVKQVQGLGELITDLSKRTTMMENRTGANTTVRR
jgi:hypothetical protein